MKGLIILSIIFSLALLNGCATGVKEINKIDASFYSLMKDSKLSLDCKAGIANGFIIAPDSNASVRAVAKALDSVADSHSEDYINCYGNAAWISFIIHGTKDLSDKIITDLITMGVMK